MEQWIEQYMIGTCKDCKWWKGESPPWLRLPPDFKQCTNDKKLRENDWMRKEKDNLIHCPMEGEPGFYTGKNFGCIHWEEKK